MLHRAGNIQNSRCSWATPTGSLDMPARSSSPVRTNEHIAAAGESLYSPLSATSFEQPAAASRGTAALSPQIVSGSRMSDIWQDSQLDTRGTSGARDQQAADSVAAASPPVLGAHAGCEGPLLEQVAQQRGRIWEVADRLSALKQAKHQETERLLWDARFQVVTVDRQQKCLLVAVLKSELGSPPRCLIHMWPVQIRRLERRASEAEEQLSQQAYAGRTAADRVASAEKLRQGIEGEVIRREQALNVYPCVGPCYEPFLHKICLLQGGWRMLRLERAPQRGRHRT